MADRKYDIIVWGATGFTGSLVAQYFAKHAPDDVVWALGGRNMEKLMGVRDALSSEEPNLVDVDVVTGDSKDQTSMDALAKQARVILSTVGPFIKYGDELVDACVRHGTHYCDITGETPWVRKLIDKYHDDAVDSGTCIVPMCGFDSMPADLGALLVSEHVGRTLHRECSAVYGFVRVHGSASGGTLATMLHMLEVDHDRAAMHPHLLSDPKHNAHTRPTEGDQLFPKYSHEMKRWTVPFIMAVANTRVVRRTHFLKSGKKDGQSGLIYNECQLVSGVLEAVLMWIGLTLAVMLVALGPLRRLVGRVVTQPGSGPSAEQRASNYFKYTFVGKPGEPIDGRATQDCPDDVRAVIAGGDPGYDETAKMVSEAAITLAVHTRPHCSEPLSLRGGVLTPASCMGMALVGRLRRAGITIEMCPPE